MKNVRVTISLRCYGRPARTMRAIESILNQSMPNYELLLTGDNCPWFEDKTQRYLMEAAGRMVVRNGGLFSITNQVKNGGGCGYEIINNHIHIASAPFFIFMSNDDVLEPNHLENYLGSIEKTMYDWVYFDSYVEPYQAPRNAQLQPGGIGHSELIVSTKFLRTMPKHGPEYGHDWKLVENMMKASARYIKATGKPQTYIVKSVPGNVEQGID